MADIRRKNVRDFPRINNCRVNPDAYSTLNRIAGPRCLAAAIEDLCNMWEAVQGKKQTASVKPLHGAPGNSHAAG
jgi:hypothetical protein